MSAATLATTPTATTTTAPSRLAIVKDVIFGSRVPSWMYPALGLTMAAPIAAARQVESNRQEASKERLLSEILKGRGELAGDTELRDAHIALNKMAAWFDEARIKRTSWGRKLQALKARRDPEGYEDTKVLDAKVKAAKDYVARNGLGS